MAQCFSVVDNFDGKFVKAIIELPFTGVFFTDEWLPNILVNLYGSHEQLKKSLIFALGIDHFHYCVTRAKVSGSCSKDRAQCHAIAGKCQKISTLSAKASYQVFYKVMCSIATQIQRNSAWSFLCFFFR